MKSKHLKGFLVQNKDFLTMIIIILLTGMIRLLIGPRIIDDAFITFRYAQNIAESQGFVYNLGERVMDTTTLFFTLMLTTFYLVFNNLTVIALTILIVSDIITLS